MTLTNFPNGVASFGAPVVPEMPNKGNVFFLDPASGNDGNDGLSPRSAFKTLAVAYSAITADQYDTLYILGGPTALTPSSAFTWAKNYCRIRGSNNGLPGMGQRSRIVNTAANDLSVLFTLSARGCLVENLQFFDGKDSAADGACLLVSGDDNHVVNCFVAGMGDATALGPATRAGSYSLQVSGAENTFRDCTIGLDTVVRSAANAELIVSGPRNKFIDCDIRSNSITAGKFLVRIDNSGGDLRDIRFVRPLFFNYTENWANGIDNVFDMPAGGNTHYVIIEGQPTLVGINSGLADVVTRIYCAAPAPNAGFGIAVNPTT